MSGMGRFLQRWSRLKRRGQSHAPAAITGESALASSVGAPLAVDPVASEVVLPAVEELDLESDFSAFLKKEVSESMRRAALRKLFSDPHFNRMDGLDIYIDDYSVSDPIPADVMSRLRQFNAFLREEAEAPAPDRTITEAWDAKGREASSPTHPDVQASESDRDTPETGEPSPNCGE